MTWVRLDDNFADHPKIDQVGHAAAWLHVAALCYSARHLTDGLIPKSKALRLTTVPKPQTQIQRLLEAELWHDRGDDYEIHDYLKYQPSRAKVEAEREAGAERQRKSRESRGMSRRDKAVTHTVSHSDPSHPVPSPLSRSTSSSLLLCVDGTEREPRVVQAIELLGHKDSDEATDVRNKKAHLSACIETRACRDGHALDIFAEQYPELDAEGLAQEFASGF